MQICRVHNIVFFTAHETSDSYQIAQIPVHACMHACSLVHTTGAVNCRYISWDNLSKAGKIDNAAQLPMSTFILQEYKAMVKGL